jgi:hypothetical protein
MAVDPSYTVRLAWHAHDLDTGGHLPADQVPYDNAVSGLTATDAQAAIDEVAASTGGSGAPTTVDYLVGTASGALSAEIVVGTTPGGELGGTWASPTVDATHSGSTHAATQAAAEATAASALSSHVADTTSAHSATGVDITDAGSYYTSTTVEGALQEIGAGGIGGGGGGGSAITAKDEGTTLTTAATSFDFVGAGVTATNTGGAVTVTVTAAGSPTAAQIAALGFVGPILMTDGITNPPEPLWTEDGTDYLYQDVA